MSSNKSEAKARVLKLYKAWYRQIPFMSKFEKILNSLKNSALSYVFVIIFLTAITTQTKGRDSLQKKNTEQSYIWDDA